MKVLPLRMNSWEHSEGRFLWPWWRLWARGLWATVDAHECKNTYSSQIQSPFVSPVTSPTSTAGNLLKAFVEIGER